MIRHRSMSLDSNDQQYYLNEHAGSHSSLEKHVLMPSQTSSSSTSTTTTTTTTVGSLVHVGDNTNDAVTNNAKIIKARQMLVFLCSLCTAMSYCDRVNLSVAVVDMSKELDWDINERALVLSAFFYGYVTSQVLGAYLAQIYGGHMVLGVAAFFWSLATMSVPFLATISFRAVMFGRIVLGIFEGCVFPVIYHLFSSRVPADERSRSLGSINMGVFSGAVFSFIVAPLLMNHLGWKSVFYFFGFVGFVWCILWFSFYFFMEKKTHPLPSWCYSSKKDHQMMMENNKKKNLLDEDVKSLFSQFKHIVCHKVVFAIFWCHFCHNIGTFVMMSWLPTFFAEEFGLGGSSLVFTCLPYITMAIAVTFTSRYADNFISSGKASLCAVRRLSTIAGFLGAGTFMLLITTSSYPPFAIACMCISLACNGAGPVAGYEAAKLDVASPEFVGKLQSISNTLAAFAGIVGVPMVAFIKNSTGSWRNVFLAISAVFYSAAFVFYRFGHYTGKVVH